MFDLRPTADAKDFRDFQSIWGKKQKDTFRKKDAIAEEDEY